jgi:beta-lactamase class A
MCNLLNHHTGNLIKKEIYYDTIIFIMYTGRSIKKRNPGGLCSIAVILILGIIAIGYLLRTSRYNNTVISPLADTNEPKSIFSFFAPKKDPDELRRMIKNQIGSTWNNYSVYVADFTSPFSMGINETTMYTGASINKLPILAAIYEEAQKGNVDFDKVITLQAEDIQDYGTGSMRYDAPGTTYSVKTLVRLAGQVSDNTAAHILGVDILSMDLIQKYVNSWGMSQTDMINNKTSNKDMEILLRKIVNSQIANTPYTAELLGFLKDTDNESRIPALLPKGVTVYHKIGTGAGEIHDVGVVVSGKVKYYIGIFTQDVTDVDAAATLSAKLSKTVFDYMKSH